MARRERTQDILDEQDRSRAWVKIEVSLVTGVFGRAQSLSLEKVFMGDVVPVSEATAGSVAEAIRGLRELATSLEGQLQATFLNGERP